MALQPARGTGSGEEVGDGVVTLTLRPFQIVTSVCAARTAADGRIR